MKLLVILIATACSAAMAASPARAQGEAEQAQQVLQQARAAAGGEKLAALQSLTVEGKTKRQMRMNRGGEAQTVTRESEFTADFLMPDKYVRRDTTEVMMGDGGFVTNISGFNGSALIQAVESTFEMPQGMRPGGGPGGGPGMGQPNPAAMVRRSQTEAARSWLAWTFSAPGYAPLQFRHAGTKDGADVIEVTGGEMPAMQLHIDQQSRRVTKMTYKAPAPRQMTMSFGGPGGAQPQSAAPSGAPEEVEVEVTYADYKAVDGVMLPHRIRRSVNGEVAEETEIKKFKLNPNLKADKFKPRSPSN